MMKINRNCWNFLQTVVLQLILTIAIHQKIIAIEILHQIFRLILLSRLVTHLLIHSIRSLLLVLFNFGLGVILLYVD
jgi:hypothetical protein